MVDFVSAQVEQMVSLAWLVPGGQFPSGSTTVDLAQLPSGCTSCDQFVQMLDGREHEARFTTVRFERADFEAGRLYFCEQLTPQLVWRREWQTHANGSTGIARFTIVDPDPERAATRFGAMLAADAYAWRPGRASVMLADCEVELVTAGVYRDDAGGDAACDPRDVHGRPRSRYMAMLTLRTASLAAARAALERGGVGFVASPGALTVAARDAFNCTLRFCA